MNISTYHTEGNRELSTDDYSVSCPLVYRALTKFRSLESYHYPILNQYSNTELYDDGQWLSPGGYLLMHLIVDKLNIKRGARILDLGAGNGQSSIFLAKEYNAEVTAIDLWIDEESRNERARAHGVADRITNIQADVSHGLSKDLGLFDYIISVQAFHCFGTPERMPNSLIPLLNKDGQFALIQSCFSRYIETLPEVFNNSNGWQMDYENYHYPKWWQNHFENNGYKVDNCEELVQGKEIWEDNILHYGNRYSWSRNYIDDYGWLMEQVLYDDNDFHLTHFLLTAKPR